MYPKAAKFVVWSTALAFTAALIFLIIPTGLRNQENSSTAMMILVVLGLPLFSCLRYIIDPVGNTVRELQFVANPQLSNFIQPLLNGINSNVRVGHYNSHELNACAISSVFGRDSVIAFSTALMSTMAPNQLMAIAAHEVAHIRSADSTNKSYILAFHLLINFYPAFISHIAKELIKKVAWMVLFLVAMMFLLTVKTYDSAGVSTALRGTLPLLTPLLFVATPIAGAFILNRLTGMYFFHYSRQREFAADADGAVMTSNADMKEALQLLSNGSTSKMGLFDTHPPISERLGRL